MTANRVSSVGHCKEGDGRENETTVTFATAASCRQRTVLYERERQISDKLKASLKRATGCRNKLNCEELIARVIVDGASGSGGTS